MSFLLTNLIGMGVNVILLRVALEKLNLRESFAVLVATLGAVLWNFLINKSYIFRMSLDAASFEKQHVVFHTTKDGLA